MSISTQSISKWCTLDLSGSNVIPCHSVHIHPFPHTALSTSGSSELVSPLSRVASQFYLDWWLAVRWQWQLSSKYYSYTYSPRIADSGSKQRKVPIKHISCLLYCSALRVSCTTAGCCIGYPGGKSLNSRSFQKVFSSLQSQRWKKWDNIF